MEDELKKSALEYHRLPRPGKISILPTKQLTNQRDLALAYTPGVAAACEEIVRDPRDLDPAVASIADELSQQYYLGYPSPGLRDGRWHTIRVEVKDPSLKVRARKGYVATP